MAATSREQQHSQWATDGAARPRRHHAPAQHLRLRARSRRRAAQRVLVGAEGLRASTGRRDVIHAVQRRAGSWRPLRTFSADPVCRSCREVYALARPTIRTCEESTVTTEGVISVNFMSGERDTDSYRVSTDTDRRETTPYRNTVCVG